MDPKEIARQLVQVALQLRNKNRYPAAIACMERAVRLDPGSPDYLCGLGNLLMNSARYEEAEKLFLRAKEEGANPTAIDHNLGITYHSLAKPSLALKHLREAESGQPGNVDLLWDTAIVTMTSGDWETGWPLYDHRFKYVPKGYPELPFPMWERQPCRRLWVWCEQGIGDIIMFSRFIPWAASMVEELVLDVPPELYALFYDFPGVTQRRVRTDTLQPYPENVDYQIPLCSLARLYRATLDDIPEDSVWFKALGRTHPFVVPQPLDPRAKKIGIVWAGNPTHPKDGERSIALEKLLPLCYDPRATIYSFQVGLRAGDVELAGAQPVIVELGAQLRDWQTTAKALLQMDRVITVDTGVAHLAASLGVKTWVLLPTVPDWRWGYSGTLTGWYPSMRLYRQERPRDWNMPLSELFFDFQAWLGAAY